MKRLSAEKGKNVDKAAGEYPQFSFNRALGIPRRQLNQHAVKAAQTKTLTKWPAQAVGMANLFKIVFQKPI